MSWCAEELTPVRSISVLPEFTWRKVKAKGKWDHAHTMLLGPKVFEGENGYQVITPLMRQDGSTVLVDRGFVPKELGDSGTFDKPEGEVEVVGLIRLSQPRNTFTPDNDPKEKFWYWRDLDAMAEYAGGKEANVQPVFFEEIFGMCLYLPHELCSDADLLQTAIPVRLWRGWTKVFQ